MTNGDGAMPGGGDASSGWILGRDGLLLGAGGEEAVPVPAADVVGVEFKGRSTAAGRSVRCRPSRDLPGVRLRRFPADLALIVTRPPREGVAPPRARLELHAIASVIPLVALPARDDQVVVDDQWFPLIPGQVEALRGRVASLPGAPPWTLGLRAYLELATGPGEGIRFEDSVAEAQPGGAVERRPQDLASSGLLRATLYPYQESGVRWLARLAGEDLGCVLGDQMGLGKSLQVIALVTRELEAGRSPTLVVSPATLLENWRREFARFAPRVRVEVHRGQDRTGFPRELGANDVVVTSYDTAVRDQSMMRMIRWNLIALDEAQAIKNPDTARAKAVKGLDRRLSIAVTGTPVENSLRDLWSILDFACPGLLGTLPAFEARYGDTEDDAGDLESVVTPLILRREIAEVTPQLPPKIEVPVAVELDPRGAALYEDLRQGILEEYGASATLVALTKLRMFCCHPFLLEEGGGDPAAVSTKYARFLEIMDEIASRGSKAIAFTSYTGMADLMAGDVRRRMGITTRIIDGRVPVPERQLLVDAFQGGRGPELLVLNPRAAGTGLNITAASHVIHYNLEWNPAVEDQATARAYRLGQTETVVVHRLFHPGTVEEIMDERLAMKRDLASAAVVGRTGDETDTGDIARALAASPFLGMERGE